MDRFLLMLFFAAAIIGCKGSNARVELPSYNSASGEAALEAYDSNKNGAIAEDEFLKVPCLKASIRQVDKDGNGRVTAAEINARVQTWIESKIGEMPVSCRVLLDDKPLANADVVFEPEPFLGSNVPTGTGKTSPQGTTGISMPPDRLADPRYAGMACGWYKIRITCADRAIPARYNTDTTLGTEIAMDAYWINDGEVTIKLTTKSDN
jgi:hypothetical protein